ncbi:MAG: hypothetical protein ACR2PL_03950 [Dehalococcoidia bacterium]
MILQTLSNAVFQVELLPEVGRRIHRLRAYGRDLPRTPRDPAQHLKEPFFWGSYPLVPRSNRIPDGTFSFRGREVTIPCIDGNTAIHGESYARPWTVLGDGLLSFQGADFGFPWPYEARQQFVLSDATLSFSVSTTNTPRESMPAGLGIHPRFDASSLLLLAFAAELAYPLADCIPSVSRGRSADGSIGGDPHLFPGDRQSLDRHHVRQGKDALAGEKSRTHARIHAHGDALRRGRV